ncbi:MAG: SpoIID/LytB domain-containing protein [Gaiellaceae bacterium]
MTHRAHAALVIAVAGLAFALIPLSAVAGSKGAKATPAMRWSPAALTFTGHGWGHGVGLSQYGAYGYAKHDYTYDQMIAHYYPGTEIAAAPSKTIRVLLAVGSSSLTISSSAPFSVTDSSGNSYDLPNLSLTLKPSLKIDLADGNGATTLSGPLTFEVGTSTEAGTSLAYAGRKYRGKFRVSSAGGRLRLVNHVNLESYLWGVVPCESPHDWPAEALKAQAVVARSYALSSGRAGSDFDVYADTRSQVYYGISHEYPESTQAVKDTKGEAVYYKDEVARTFFFSTSGGRTAAIKDAWPKARPVPYLVSVNDPYDDASPYHSWGPVTFSPQKLARLLRVNGPISDLTTKQNGSKRVSKVTIVGAGGATSQLSGDSVKLALGLRSNWFTTTVLSLQYPSKAVAAGSTLRLKGRARNATSPALETRTSSGAWKKLRDLNPGAGGLFKVRLSPTTSAYYRLVAEDAVGTPVRIKVR